MTLWYYSFNVQELHACTCSTPEAIQTVWLLNYQN